MATSAHAPAAYTPGSQRTTRPLLLVHGYSDTAKGFHRWRDLLAAHRPVEHIHVGSYVSLSNEVTIKDIAEGLDRAMRHAGLGDDAEFDAIVHSTGMLVVRAWLTTYPERRRRLKHLIGLAPASFGSPLAHKGRSWLGALFKGNRDLGPDFLEAGDRVLDALELGSRFTWELAHQDLVGREPYYGPEDDTPYAFVFVGNRGYRGLRKLLHEDGSDGTVRWAGCSLDTRKVTVDLTRGPRPGDPRAIVNEWPNVTELPVVLVDDHDHGSIMSAPSETLQALVREALDVHDAASHARWCERARLVSGGTPTKGRWQQFVIRVVDERGDPVPDYNVKLHARKRGGRLRELDRFDMEVHVYGGDASLRCFHVNLDRLPDAAELDAFEMRLTASSGSQLVGYRGFDLLANSDVAGLPVEEARVDLMPVLVAEGRPFTFFYPFTTTLVEIRLNREPLPTDGKNGVCWL